MSLPRKHCRCYLDSMAYSSTKLDHILPHYYFREPTFQGPTKLGIIHMEPNQKTVWKLEGILNLKQLKGKMSVSFWFCLLFPSQLHGRDCLPLSLRLPPALCHSALRVNLGIHGGNQFLRLLPQLGEGVLTDDTQHSTRKCFDGCFHSQVTSLQWVGPANCVLQPYFGSEWRAPLSLSPMP